ncbi:MAG: hypothetical protein BAJALOKI3v1_20087 [Promethearchaeota archaeon]|nr:MAG: hypothetical protein BAJALOKI3v1_20087 [Candidatus Lokiarchaeota archaeon]
MSKIDIDELLKILPKLIRENDTVKGAIISALSGVVATHEDIVELNKAMDKRFEAMQKTMDKRFEAMDKRFEAMQKTMDERFEAMQKTMDKRFEAMDKRFEAMDKRFETIEVDISELKNMVGNIQQTLGKPFEQFARNVVVRILDGEGMENVQLESRKFRDPERFVSEGIEEVEIDGFSLTPPIVVEITSILRSTEKVHKFLRKKEFLERKYQKDFRGFFIAASTEFPSEEIGEITVLLRKKNSELLNL